METLPSTLDVMPPGTPTCISPEVSQHEPPMHVPRPSSDRAQDVSHILASVFRDLYTRDVMSKDTVQNLTRSSEGSTKFHKKCMDQLTKVHLDHQDKLEEYNALERHIIQARARATSADEKALNRVAGDIGSEKYQKLGLPPVPSHFQSSLSEDKLKSQKMIVPSDLFSTEHQLTDGPRVSGSPRFHLHTITSSHRFKKQAADTGYIDDSEQHVQIKSWPSRNEKHATALLAFNESGDAADEVTRKSYKVNGEKNEKVKDRWRENMNHNTRIESRAILAKLEERQNFLKNPRFMSLSEPKATKLLTKNKSKQEILKAGRKVCEDTFSEDEIQFFVSNPPVVTFTEWTVGRVYEAILELRNISTISRQLRVLPPKTSFFSLGLGKYPGPESFVAPGMSAKYNIRFIPDSLADHEDEIEVVSQAAEHLVVKIQAIRTPPVLSLSDKLECGYCLVGGIKGIDLPIKNSGGNGRFCVLKKSMWPASNFKTVVNPSGLEVGAFQIRPSVFEVLAGETISIEMLFSPEEAKDYSEELVLICDNCQVKHFTIEGCGENAAVELISVSDGGEETHKVGETRDLTANHLIRFPSLNPHSFYMRQILVHNSTNVEMPYTWNILKPNLVSGLDAITTKDGDWDKVEFYPDESSSFFIEPRSGMLQPNGIHEFVMTFAPHQVGEYRNIFHLALSNIPDVKDSKPQTSSGRALPIGLVDGSEKLTHSNRDESAPRLSRSSSSVHSGPASNTSSYREVISLEVEVEGQSIPYSVVLHPPAIVVPGTVLLGTTVRRPLRMANYSLAPVQYEWSNEMNPNIVEVKPPLGLINPGEVADMEVLLTGAKPGAMICDLSCSIEHQDEPMKLSVNADIMGPKVEIDNLYINYGLIQLGSSVSEKLFIRNTTQLNAKWTLTTTHGDSSELIVSPSSGELQSLDQQEVKVTFKPNTCQSLNTFLNIKVFGGEGLSVGVKGEVQTQQVCFDECTVVMKDTFLSVPRRSTVKLINQTLFPTSFCFGKLHGDASYDVTVLPLRGVLSPREERDVEVIFTGHVIGEVSELFLPCQIEGMDHPIVLGFYANLRDLALEYATPEFGGPGLKIDFQGPVTVGKIQTAKVIVTNLTAIRAPWSASVQNFQCSPSLPRQPAHDFKSMKTRRAMLGRTPNLADPLSKTPNQAKAEHSKLMLREGKGVAFSVEPHRGHLEPYMSQEINVVAYSDMWGAYKDILTIQPEGLESQSIPIEVNVVGSPLKFQIANDNNKDAVVRFGAHLEGGASVSRKLRINNSSQCDIRVDWRTFNYPEPDDKKLIDLNIWFGDAFPLITKNPHDAPKTSHLRYSSGVPETNSPSSTQKVESNQTSSESSPTFIQNLPKLVNVRLAPHMGKQSDAPYHIDPPQVVVPGHGQAMVSSTFKPIVTNRSDVKGKECLAYTRGYMSLDSVEMKNKDGKVIRSDGYEIEPLRLEMTSFVRPGLLNIETEDDEDHVTFHMPLSLLNNEELDGREPTQQRYCTLSNSSETALAFKLTVNEPFFIRTGNQTTQVLAQNNLDPQHNMKIYVGFKLSRVALEQLQLLREGKVIDGLKLDKDIAFGVEKLVWNKDLSIRYDNGITQEFPMMATVPAPSFCVSTSNIDFGICFVGQTKQDLIHISNQSGASTRWRATITDAPDSKKGEFHIEPDSGILDAFVSHYPRNKDTLTLSFVARSESSCDATIIFEGDLGEPRHVIKVMGAGSYNGEYELK